MMMTPAHGRSSTIFGNEGAHSFLDEADEERRSKIQLKVRDLEFLYTQLGILYVASV